MEGRYIYIYRRRKNGSGVRREEGGRRRGEGVYTRTEVKEYIGRST